MIALWVIAAGVLLLAAVAARAYWAWATTSTLDRLTDREVAAILHPQGNIMATPIYPPVDGYDDAFTTRNEGERTNGRPADN